jgi:N-acetylglucosamine kinase-like BadF-type ATPase
MKLIADSGSTKTDWVLCDKEVIGRYSTIGYNPFFIQEVGIVESLEATLLGQVGEVDITEVYFYGAGCSSADKRLVVEKALEQVFTSANCEVNHDLLASARALLGRTAGFAAILGTGANTCLYDGNTITHNVDSLGYLIGDEGSGSFIGRKIVRDFMRQALPVELKEAFDTEYGFSNADLYDHLYFKPLPNRFLASFSKFAGAHIEHPYMQQIVRESFDAFFTYLVSRYPEYQRYPFNCVGSVGFVFSGYLTESAHQHGMQVGKIIKSPIDDLVAFHLSLP